MPYKDPEQARAYHRTYYQKNRERVLGWQKALKEASPEHYRQLSANRSLRYYHAHKKESKEYRHARGQRLKLQVFQAYGGAICLCCRESHIEFLSIDHIGGGGAIHRRALGKNCMIGNSLYQWIVNQRYPAGFRVLCMNCNFALGKYGYCPHGNLDLVSASPNGHNATQLPLFEN